MRAFGRPMNGLNDVVSASVSGDKELDRRLLSLEHGATAIIERAALQAGKPVEAAIKAAAPVSDEPRKVRGRTVRPGAMRRSVGRRRLTRKRDHAIGAKIGFNVGRRKTRAPHAHLYLLGTDERHTGARRRKRRGRMTVTLTRNPRRYRGRVEPHDIVRRAVAATEPQAEAELRRVVAEELDRRLAR